MLVLTRRRGENLILTVPPSNLPRQIVVGVAAIERGRVKIGIQADRDVAIVREELAQQPNPALTRTA